jgi:hypothetical protein
VLRLGVSFAVGSGVLALGMVPAIAEDGASREADATQDARGNPTVVAMSELDRPAQPGRRATGVVTCTWFEPSESTQFDATKALPGPPVPPGSALVDDHVYYRACENGDGEVVFRGWTRWTAAEIEVLAADLAYEASRELPLPYPRPVLSPAIGADQLVGLPTWLWLEPGSWATLDATASVPGPVGHRHGDADPGALGHGRRDGRHLRRSGHRLRPGPRRRCPVHRLQAHLPACLCR